MIKTNKISTFNDDCHVCTLQNRCISATRVCYGDRKFLLSLRNSPVYTKETKQLFKGGIERHERRQAGIKTIQEYGYINFRRDLYKHKVIRLKELKVCSTLGFHGIIDLVTLEWTKNKVLNIYVNELKSHYSPSHYLQLVTYITILSDLKSKLIYEVPMKRNNRTKRKLGHLFPNRVDYLNIKGKLEIFSSTKPSPYHEFVVNNQFTELGGSIKSAINKRARVRREAMLNKIIDICAVKYCKGCSEEKKSLSCGWRDLCSRYPYNPQLRQLYFSQHKIKMNKDNFLIKTKVVRR